MDINELKPMNSSTSAPLTFYNEISPFNSSTHDSTPYSNMSSVVDLDTDMFNVDDHHQNHIPMQNNNPCFRILYVLDPTCNAITPALVSVDLAFIKTIIMPDEYMSMNISLGVFISMHVLEETMKLINLWYTCKSGYVNKTFLYTFTLIEIFILSLCVMVQLVQPINHTSKTNQFLLDFMDWDTFFQTMLNHTEHSNT
jgi:hypothetical protein